MEPSFVQLTALGYPTTPLSSTNRYIMPAIALVRPILSKLPAEIANVSPVKSLKTCLDANWMAMFPEPPT